ncbi:hypothetical protein FDUTEX481_03599 [Tolypothrix sp. PCC 7601]|nr:hypothetical protein FDUTEX481_03599 [Tolypothrix sp. PCC 7601]BAY90406.1 hypothetical protein NIES3275_24220 [Microchaete diplosiphon NIES-3275]
MCFYFSVSHHGADEFYESPITYNTVQLKIFRHGFRLVETRFIASLQDLNVN